MGQRKSSSRGFTLIAALLILVLLSGVAAGLLYMVTNESRMGGNDLESNLAFYGAESGMEKLTADLSALYTSYNGSHQCPDSEPDDHFPPTPAMVSGMNYQETITYPLDANGNPASSFNTVSSGSNQGLYARNHSDVAAGDRESSVGRVRQHDAQSGSCADSGFPVRRVLRIRLQLLRRGQTLASAVVFIPTGICSSPPAPTWFSTTKSAAYQQIITDRLENGFITTGGYGGTIYVPKASGGCALSPFPPPGAELRSAPRTRPPFPATPAGAAVIPPSPAPPMPISPASLPRTFNGFLANSLTGATTCSCPLCRTAAPAIRRPAPIPLRLSASPSPENRPPAPSELRACTTRRRFASCWPNTQ